MTKHYTKTLVLALVAALSMGVLTGCESEQEKQARLYKEFINAGGNPRQFNGVVPP